MTFINQQIAHAVHSLEQKLYRTQYRQLIQGSKFNVLGYKCQLLEDSNTRLNEALIHQSDEQLLLSNELQALKGKPAAPHPSPVTPTKKEGGRDNPWGTPSKWRNRPLLDEKQDAKAEPTVSHHSPVSPTKKSTPYVNPHGTPSNIKEVEGKQAASCPSPPVSPTPTKGLGQSKFAISYDTPSKSRNSTTSSPIFDDDTLMQGSRLDGKHNLEQRDNKRNEASALPSYGFSSPHSTSSNSSRQHHSLSSQLHSSSRRQSSATTTRSDPMTPTWTWMALHSFL
jgi:hypothetical protein